MSETDYVKYSNFFIIAFLIVFIHSCTSAPVNVTENAYTQFVAELNRNKCSFPSQVQLPFDTTQENNFEYFSSYMKICQKTESAKRNKEAVVLCKEIFDNIRNISCLMKTALPDVISVNLSQNVCQDIGALKDSVPEDKSFLKTLTDGFVCDIMCDNEFEKACQVLLWSFQVQKQIASVASAPEPVQPNLLGGTNGVNKPSDTMDSFKQDNTDEGSAPPESNVDPPSEKKSAEETKGASEVVGHDEIAEVPEPSKFEESPEQKLEKSNSDKNEAIPENQADFKATNQNTVDAPKSTSSSKVPNSFTPQELNAQTSNSNTEVKSMDGMTRDISDDQNANKQLHNNLSKNDEINTRGELPQGSNTNAITVDQTQDVKANTLTDKPVQEKDADVLDKHLQGDSLIPANQEVPVDGDTLPGNEIPDDIPEKGDQNSNLPNSNDDLPHESTNDKSPNDASSDLGNEQNPSNTVDKNKLQSTASNDDDLVKQTSSSTTNTQIATDKTQQQTEDKTSTVRDETKVDQPPIDSVSKKVEETQDHSKTDPVIHDLKTGDGTKNPSINQKESKVSQQTEEFDNTIPDTTETAITDDKPPKKSQKSKPSAVNLDHKSVIPSSLVETSTKTTVALEKMEGGSDLREPADEEADHYGEPENAEGDEYSGPDYDGGFGEVSRGKASNPSPITAAKEIITNQDESPIDFPSRNAFGQDSSNIQMISSFPEQEDSHFFFYFLSMVLILMAGYLIFHNKQKIIALIVEGRHERNRRSHRIGYKKLETK